MKKFSLKIALPLLLAVVMCIQPVNAARTAAKAGRSGQKKPSAQVLAKGFEEVLENGRYSLALNPDDGNVAVTDKNTGIIRYTNPVDADKDKLAVGGKGSVLKSQVLVQYYENNTLVMMNSNADCIKYDAMTYETVDDVLNVTYVFGDASFDSNLIPTVLTKERMEKDILPKLSEDEREEVLDRFRFYSKSELPADAYDTLIIQYPSLAEYDIYVREKIPAYKAEEFYGLFLKAGYTNKDLQKDYDQNGLENPYKPKATFYVTLEYKLTDDGFNATVDPKKIKYVAEFAPVRVDILPYFHAADNKDNGYMFVPDGSGSLIYLNNNKYTVNTYEKRLFEVDNTLAPDEMIATYQESVLPVFALSGKNSGFYATIDSGYEEAGIAASVAGNTSYYNNVYPFFDLLSHGTISYSSTAASSNVLIMTERFTACKFSVSYHFIDGGTTYAQIATDYRRYLQDTGFLPAEAKSDNTELNVEIIASAYVQKRFLGIPYTSLVAMTDYDETVKILKELDGIKTEVNFVNAMSGGILQSNTTDFKPLSVLGSKSEREELAEKAGRLTFSYNAQYAADIKNSHTAKRLDRSNARKYNYDLVGRNVLKTNSLKILSPLYFPTYAEDAKESLDDNGIKSINLQDIAYELCSDFKVGAQIDRYWARRKVQQYLSKISKDRYVTANIGSIYSFNYIDKILEIPVTHTGYKIEDKAVPFYQIVISGLIPYGTASVNCADEGRVQFLKTVEVGGQLQYTWYYEKPENLTYSRENYYGMSYADSIEDAKAQMKLYKPLYQKIAGKAITDHCYLEDKVSKTVYENGITVYVNYSEADKKVDGVTVKALDFTMIGG